MRRREFIALLSGGAGLPLAARAQPTAQKRRLGLLMNGPEHEPVMQKYLGAFEQQIRALGWIENQNIRIDRRYTAGNAELTRRYAPELVALAPDVIMSLSSVNLKALRQATQTIPIVFALVSDPVAQGFVPNLTRPGGNVTGFTAYEASMGGKWADMLKQFSPGLAQVALLFNPDISIQSKQFMSSINVAAPLLGVEARVLPVRTVAEIEKVLADLARGPKSGLIIPTDQFLSVHRTTLVERVAQLGLPAIYAQREFVSDGGLMFYGTDQAEQVRRGAIYVDRILRGTKPGDLPVQNPTRFHLGINMKAARALGMEVPLGLLLAADEVIE